MKGVLLSSETTSPKSMDAPTRRPVPPPQQANEDLFDLTSLHVVWQGKWLILFFILVFSVLGVFQIKRTTPIYTSEATAVPQNYPNDSGLNRD